MLARQLDYWRKKLAGYSSVLDLPTDWPRPPRQRSVGARLMYRLTPDLGRALKELSQHEDVTLFATLCAGFNALLYRYTGQEDIVVGAPVAARTHPDTERLIGCLINTLVLRTDLAGNPTVRELLRSTQHETLAALAHQDLPFEQLVAELKLPRDLSRPPLFQVLLQLRNVPRPSGEWPGLRVEPLQASTATAKVDLSLDVQDLPDGLRVDCEYNTDLFRADTISRVLGHFEVLLRGIVTNPDARLSELPLLTTTERQQILVEWNDTATEYPRDKCVHELFEEQAARTPDATAVEFGGRLVTYAELNRRANQLAYELRDLGVGPDVPVGLCVERSVDMVVGVLGILKAGGAYLPLDVGYPTARLGLVMRDAQARLVVTHSRLSARIPGAARRVAIDALPARVEAGFNPRVTVSSRNLAYVIHTSGSTGRPKGVAIEHQGVANYLVYLRTEFGLGSADAVLHVTSLSFDPAVRDLLGPLVSGGRAVLVSEDEARDPEALWRVIRARGVTCLLSIVPGVLRALVGVADVAPASSRLRLVMSCGEALPWDSVRHTQRRLGPGVEIVNQYGPTECTMSSLFHRVGGAMVASGIVPIGRPIPNRQAYVLGPGLSLLPVGVPGELHLGGVGLARGYQGQPELTARQFVPDPFSAVPGARLYRTGDRARWRADGQIEFLGRQDQQVKIRGFRIELEEVEAVLRGCPGVRECAATVHGDDVHRRLVAYVVPQPGEECTPETLCRHTQKQLPEYMVPAVFVLTEKLPLTSNGKVDRRVLATMVPTVTLPPAGHELPRTPTEQRLAGIWSELLHTGPVGREDSFFELGGHSLLATTMVSRVRAMCGVELPLRAVFESPALAELAKVIERSQQTVVTACRQAGPCPPRSAGSILGHTASREIHPQGPGNRADPGALAGPTVFPTSFIQARLWFLSQYAAGSPVYHACRACRIVGTLNAAALEAGINAIVQRHAALRTTFHVSVTEVTQALHAQWRIALPVVDLASVPSAQREAEVHLRLRTEALRLFDLERGPLLRCTLFRLAADEHVLLLVFHHIVHDGWSVGVFNHELGTFYGQICTGHAPWLPDLPIQYADFAVWQRQWLTGAVLEKLAAYWRAKLTGAPAALELPTDHPRSSTWSFRGARELACLGGDLSVALAGLAKAERATLSMVLLASMKALFQRYTGQEDIVIGTPIANRTRAEVEGLIGCFLNTLALRTDLSGDPTFRELLARVRRTALEAYDHQDLPFEKLVDLLPVERSPNRTPLFQVMLAVQNFGDRSLLLDRLAVEPLPFDEGVALFDLTVFVYPQKDAVELVADYRTDLFDQTRIRRLLGHWQTLLQGVVANPDLRLSELPLLTAAEQQQLLVEWNNTAAEYPRDTCVHELFEAQVARTPDAVAVEFGDQCLTYAELNRRANQLAHHLQERVDGRELLVGLYLEDGFDTVVSMLGVLKAGGAYVPLDPSYPRGRLASMISEARFPVLLTLARLESRLPVHGATVIRIDQEWSDIAKACAANPSRVCGAEQLAYVMFTSGSSGRPKGVMITHRALANHMHWMLRAFAFTAADRVLQKTPISFDASVWEFYAPLLSGGRLVLTRVGGHRDPAYLVETMLSRNVTTAQFVPTLLEAVLRVPAFAECRVLRQVFCGGEVLPADLASRFFRQSHGTLHNLYGPTEATIDATFWTCRADHAGGSLPIGRPVANTRIYIVDAHANLVPAGVPGELWIGGDGVAGGYLHQPELTAERFVPDRFSPVPGARLYRTGDRACWRADGQIEFLGRLDQQVKLRGFRIELEEVEAILRGCAGVRECAVTAHGDGADKRLVGYVVPAHGEPCTPEALRDRVREHLPQYMVPSTFVLIDKLPLTPNGKIDRQALPAPPSPGQALSGQPPVAPRGPTEELLAALWCQILNMERVGTRESFFDLGGHSLLAFRLTTRVREVLGVELPINAVFEAPTIETMARLIQGLRGDASDGVVPRSSHGHGVEAPASLIQQGLWFLHCCAPDSAFYNVNLIWRLKGSLDEAALGRACAELARRHEALRTCFRAKDRDVWQVVDPPVPAVLLTEDLTELPSSEREATVRQRLETAAHRPFDLCHGPLYRARLLKLQEEEYILHVGVHHIVFDEWSAGVLQRELEELYGAYSLPRASRLPELPVQYSDFALWERQRWENGGMEQHLEYWRGRFPDAPAVLDLPTDHPRPHTVNFRGAQQTGLLEAGLSRDLRALSGREGTTLFMTLLAGFFTLLQRYTGHVDIVVGVPVTMRRGPETEGLIGDFVNTVAARADLSGDPSFRELLQQVKTVCLEAYAHREVPFGRLVEELRLPRVANRSPLYDIMFALLNADQASLNLQGMQVQPVHLPGGDSKFDLTWFIEDRPAGLSTTIEYATDLFAAASVGRMLGHWQTLLQGIVANPDLRLSELPLLTAAERRQILFEWNNTATEYPRDKCVHEVFEEQAASTPDAVAVELGDQCLTYAELNRRADLVAGRLRASHVQADDLIGFGVERSLAMVAGLLGVLKAGGAYWPVDADLPDQRLELLLADARPKLIIVPPREVSRLAALAARAATSTGAAPPPVVTIESLLDDVPHAPLPMARRSRPEDLAYVLYTSGSTGLAKGVMVPHRAVVRLVRGANYVELTPRETLLHVAPLSFDASTFELWGALLNGGRVVLLPPGQPSLADIGRAIREHGVTTLWLTSGLFHAMVDERLADLEPLRQLLTGGDVLAVAQVRKAFRALPGCRLVNGYGPTENTTFTCCYTVADERELEPSVPIGRPIANTRVYILDEFLQPLPVGVPGELYSGGDGVARGYLHRPELTAERFIPDPFSPVPGARLYRTGDRARWRADGQIEFLGRLDQQVKLRGFRVELEEVEAVLRGYAGVRECAVTVHGDGVDKRLVGYVVPEHGASWTTEVLRDQLRQHLPQYMVPSAFVLIEKLPLNPNGKVERKALPGPADLSFSASNADDVPRTLLELELVRIWERLFHREGVGRQDNFFDLGGHSLLAAHLMAQVERLVERRLPIATLFQAPTVELLARRLTDADWAPAWSSLVPLQAKGSRPPFFFVHGWGGDVFRFLDLARLLGPDQPSYGIQALGLDGRSARHRTVEEMAAHYVREILAFRPVGPYYIGGYSLGGVIAFEVARQLQARGQRVGMLALFDTHPTYQVHWLYGTAPLVRHLGGRLILHVGRWMKLPLRERAGYIRGRVATLRHYLPRSRRRKVPHGTASPAQPSLPDRDDHDDYYRNAVANYRAKSFVGTADLFLSDTADVARMAVWKRYLRGGVASHAMAGKHLEILDADHIAASAAVFRQALQAAQERAECGEVRQ